MVVGKTGIFHEADRPQRKYLYQLVHILNDFDTERIVSNVPNGRITNHVVHPQKTEIVTPVSRAFS
jgi:hypothetical protein